MTRFGITLAAVLLSAFFSTSEQCYSSPLYLDSAKGWANSAGKVLNGVVGTWDAEQKTAILTTDLNGPVHFLSSGIRLEGNGFEVKGCMDTPVTCKNKNGVVVEDMTDIEVNDLTVSRFVIGLLLNSSMKVKVKGLSLTDNNIGARLENCKEIEITESDLVKNKMGAIINNCVEGVILSNNVISENLWHGVKFTKSRGISIAGNTFEKNGMGGIVFVKGCNNNSCYENDFLSNGRYGILLGSNSGENHIYRNNFIGNYFKHVWSIRRNYFSKPLPLGGNYWGEGEYQRYPKSYSPNIKSPWTTPDLDENGIVDRRYPIYALYSYKKSAYDEFPWASKSGWLRFKEPTGP